jgi:hypothetical protein
MVKFKVIKYKHQKQMMELRARTERGEIPEDEANDLLMSLIEDWDFCDIETGEPIPVGQPDELTMEQYNEIGEAFQEVLQTKVPNQNGEQSHSGLTRSRAKKR